MACLCGTGIEPRASCIVGMYYTNWITSLVLVTDYCRHHLCRQIVEHETEHILNGTASVFISYHMTLMRRTSLALYRHHRTIIDLFFDINLPRAFCKNSILFSIHLYSKMSHMTCFSKRHLAADILIGVDSCCCSILHTITELTYFALMPQGNINDHKSCNQMCKNNK